MLRRSILAFVSVLTLAGLAACAKQQDTATTSTTTDSLLASNPVEQPQGSMTPSTEYTEPAPSSNQPTASSTPSTSKPKMRPASKSSSSSVQPAPREEPGTTVAAGTAIKIAVQTKLTTETAHAGDTWTGEVKENVIVGDKVAIPAGSTVTGVVVDAKPAEKGSRASLDLAVRSISVNGHSNDVAAGTEAIVAGSTRARNLGAVAGGAAAGALIGKAVGGSGKGALIGGLIGAGAAGGAVAASKGYQVTINEGTEITFSVSDNVKIRS